MGPGLHARARSCPLLCSSVFFSRFLLFRDLLDIITLLQYLLKDMNVRCGFLWSLSGVSSVRRSQAMLAAQCHS